MSSSSSYFVVPQPQTFNDEMAPSYVGAGHFVALLVPALYTSLLVKVLEHGQSRQADVKAFVKTVQLHKCFCCNANHYHVASRCFVWICWFCDSGRFEVIASPLQRIGLPERRQAYTGVSKHRILCWGRRRLCFGPFPDDRAEDIISVCASAPLMTMTSRSNWLLSDVCCDSSACGSSGWIHRTRTDQCQGRMWQAVLKEQQGRR